MEICILELHVAHTPLLRLLGRLLDLGRADVGADDPPSDLREDERALAGAAAYVQGEVEAGLQKIEGG